MIFYYKEIKKLFGKENADKIRPQGNKNMKYVHNNHGVCSRCVYFTLEDGKVSDVSFEGGCNGNLKAISKLVEGQDAKHIIEILKGNDCGGRGTSCADQFAQGLEEALAKENA